MQAKAYLRYLRVSPRKVKIVLDLIRNKDLREALAILANTPKMVCRDIEKLVKSAAANAENNHNMDKTKLMSVGIAWRRSSSTTKTASASPEISRFRFGKFLPMGAVSGSSSEITPPFTQSSS